MSVHFDPKANSWYFVVDAPRGSDGKRNQKFSRGHATETAALKAQEKFLLQFGHVDLTADGTVAAELTDWLEDRELDVAPTTLSNYRNAVNKYIIPHLGRLRLYDLDARQINELYRKLLKGGNRKGGPLSPETVRHVHRTLRKALTDLGVAIVVADF